MQKHVLLVVSTQIQAMSRLRALANARWTVRLEAMIATNGEEVTHVLIAQERDLRVIGAEYARVEFDDSVPGELREQYLLRIRPKMSRYDQPRFQTPHVTPNAQTYVVGFAWDLRDRAHPQVCLVRKEKPLWQAGSLNGVGGKIEPNENRYDAMSREFFEETGVAIPYGDWHLFYVMRFANGAVVHMFTTTVPPNRRPRTMETEVVDMHTTHPNGIWIDRPEKPIIHNLRWLIPMSFHQLIEPPEERVLTS